MKRTSLATLIGLSLVSANAATLTSGHVDAIGIGYDGTDLEPHSHADPDAIIDGSPVGNAPDGAEYEPGDLTIQTSTTSLRAADGAWDPIGVSAGQSFWILPQANTPGQPFAGIAAEELTPADWTSDITITLTGMSGPAGGQFSLHRVSAEVPTFYMSTLNGIDSSDTVAITPGAHRHYAWNFTAEGNYDLTFEISGTHTVDGPKTASATYSFSVIPEPSSALLGAFGALALLRRRRN